MLRFVIGALGAVGLFTACSNSTIRSQEGQACSISSSDDPQLICSPAQDLVCIATYSRMITNEKEAAKFDGGIRQVYVCRLACNTNAQCPQAGDVCCLGVVYGKTYNKKGGCAPPGSCEMGLVEEEADSGAPADGGGGGDAGGDRPADAGVTPDVVAPDGISGGTAG